jgi:hypothetical protein
MTRKQREALAMLRKHGDSVIGHGGGVLTSSASCLVDGQPWIHWRTAQALERLGLACIDYATGEYNPEITLNG